MAASHKEISNIWEAIAEASDLKDLALATVVDVEGSSYRRCGARMLIKKNGNWIGAISGGCLEGNALRQARQVMLDGVPRLVTYDSRTDEAAKEIGASLGCNGLIRVWIEPLEGFGAAEVLEKLKASFWGNRETWWARVIEAPDGGFADAGQFFELWGEKADDLGLAPLLSQEEGLHRVFLQGQSLTVSLERVRPVLHLMIFGGGYDAEPVSRMAKELGWRVSVTDDCAAKALPLRFPSADRVLHLPRESAVEGLLPDAYSAVLLISHNYEYDAVILKGLAGYDPAYVGVLGPRKRFERLCEEVEGLAERAVHAPVGLDIGAETPLEIALAIIAEIQAVVNHRSGGSLKDRKGYIHTRNPLKI